MSIELINVASSPKAAKKRGALLAGAEERVSLIDSEGQPSEPINGSSSSSTPATTSETSLSGIYSWIPAAVAFHLPISLTGGVPSNNNQDPAAKKRRRRRKKKPSPEEEEFVSLLGGDGQPTRSAHKSRRRSDKAEDPLTWKEQYEEFRREWSFCRMVRYFLLMLSSASVTYFLMRKTESKVLHWDNQQPLLQPPVPQDQRCHSIGKDIAGACQCPDPDVDIPQSISSGSGTSPDVTTTTRILQPWKQQHDRMVEDARRSVNTELDIVMIGDSIIERWNGTRHMGSERIPGMRQVFKKRFTKAGGGMYEGLALGCSGDMGPNLLWHLRHGLLEPLYPKVWMVLIGTNDLFSARCADKFVFANILNVLQELHQHRPDAQFIVHGVLPRKDPKHNETQFLGEYWRISQHVNAKLKRFCNGYSNLHYLQGGSAFMVDNDSARGRKQIDPQLMADGVHPTRKGLERWGEFIIDKLNQTLIFAEEQEAAERKKNRHSHFHIFGGGGTRQRLLLGQEDDVIL